MAKELTGTKVLVEGAGQCSDLLYGSGFHPVDPVVFVDGGRRRTLVVPMLEYGRAKLECPGVRVVLPEELGIPKEQRRRLAAWVVAAVQAHRVKRVVVGAFFPAAMLRALEEAGIAVTVWAGAMYPDRARKRPDEVAHITQAQRAAVAAMHTAEAMLRTATVGRGGVLRLGGRLLTSERVREEIDLVLLRHGCTARDTIVAGGAQAADPHDRGNGPLRAGTTIVVDIFPQHKQSHYWGDITRTFCKGPPPPALAALYRTVKAAQLRALAMIRPGVKGPAIHGMIAQFFEEQGYPMTVKDGVVRGFFHGTGHGVGLEIHEAPSISTVDTALAAGHVVTVEPGLYDPDLGGVRIEDTVLVTERGAKILRSYPKRFEV